MIFNSKGKAGTFAKVAALLCALLAILIYAMPYFDVYSPIFELFLQYRLHLAVIYVLFLLFLLLKRFFVLFFVVFVLFSLHLWGVLSVFYLGAEKVCQGSVHSLRVMTANIYHLNEDYDAILSNIQNINPDIVFMQEVKSGFYHRTHQRLSQRYPFHHLDLREGIAQGGALYSKYPIESAMRKRMKPYNSVIDVHIDVKGKHLDFIGLHAASPRTSQRIRNRNGFIQTVAPFAQEKMTKSDLFIVAGDFNSAPWHPIVKKFKNTTNLNNMKFLDFVRIQGTWPSKLPSIVQVPIDHIYYSDKFVNSMYYKGLSAGSDHYSLYTDLNFCD